MNGAQYCRALGNRANCKALVAPTLARERVPVPLRLYLPEACATDSERRERAKV